MNTKRIMIAIFIYTMPGFLLGLSQQENDKKDYECVSPGAPHGYISIWRVDGVNPDSENCVSRASKADYSSNVPFFILFGTPLLIAKAIH